MNPVDEIKLCQSKVDVDSDVSVGGPVFEDESERKRNPSIFVDLKYKSSYTSGGSVEVELYGEELKRLLKGHTFFFGEKPVGDIVRGFRIGFD
jgi:hypothetical protein